MKQYSIGIDIGGTKCAVSLGRGQLPEQGLDGFLLDRIAFPTEVEKGAAHALSNIKAAVWELLRRRGAVPKEAAAVGISCGGPLDYSRGVILNPPNLCGWEEVPIVRMMENEFEIPAFLQNDANACALAEWRFGAARGRRNVIFLTCGTGMGAGLILDGRLYHGAADMAGEIGHIRMTEIGPVGYGKAGAFEGYCSGSGIAQLARIKVREAMQAGRRTALCPNGEMPEELTAQTVAEAAKRGDAVAREIYAISGRYLGAGLAVLIDLLNPEIIVLGSIYERSKELLWPSMQEMIQREALPVSAACCRIVPAQLGDRLGDYAALSVALLSGASGAGV